MPVDLPPPIVVIVEAPAAIGARAPLVLMQDPPQPSQAPQLDLTIEVIGTPLQAKLQDISRLLGRRQMAGSVNRRYPPTILELITLVERNPAKPRGREWDRVGALTIRYHREPRHLVVEYCIDYCDFDPRTGAFHPRRKMVSYRATEAVVEKRLDKKLGELKKYAEPARPQ